jgi:hypothetical protein
MNLILGYWNRRWQSVAFDPTLGRGRVRWLARKPQRCSGWAFHYRGRWYAVRIDANDLVFQAGPNKWTMNRACECESVRHDGARLFTIYQGTNVILQVRYDVAPELNEPTTDSLDFESIDFFYWAAKVWNDSKFKSDLKSAWSDSESHG